MGNRFDLPIMPERVTCLICPISQKVQHVRFVQPSLDIVKTIVLNSKERDWHFCFRVPSMKVVGEKTDFFACGYADENGFEKGLI